MEILGNPRVWIKRSVATSGGARAQETRKGVKTQPSSRVNLPGESLRGVGRVNFLQPAGWDPPPVGNGEQAASPRTARTSPTFFLFLNR